MLKNLMPKVRAMLSPLPIPFCDIVSACADSSLTIVARILSAFTIGSAFKTLQLSSDFLIVAWCVATLWMLLFVFLFLSTAWRFA